MPRSIFALGTLAVVNAKIYFQEKFNPGWEKRWVKSTAYEGEGLQGEWEISPGMWYKNKKDAMGLRVAEDGKHYGISAHFEPFSNEGKSLYISYTVKFDVPVECGGGYIKLGPEMDDPKNFTSDTPYYIMFGPDWCNGDESTHVIFENQGKYVQTRNTLTNFVGSVRLGLSTLMRLQLHSNNTAHIYTHDMEVLASPLKDAWSFLEDEQIPDPEDEKPADWVDQPMLPDPDATSKPEDWVDHKRIPDTSATKPDDWDDEEDGVWQPPMMDNPEYIGEWTPGMMPNPDYIGRWAPTMIDNPDYFDDDLLYKYDDIAWVGFELWHVTGGIMFDNIIITDDYWESAEVTKKWEKTEARERRKRDIAWADNERKANEELELERQRAAEEDASDMEES